MFTYTPDAAAKLGVLRLAAGRSVAFTGATLIDGTDRQPIQNSAILVEDGLIRAIGPRPDVQVQAGAEIIDTTGKWIVPGLIDCHIHLNGETTLDMYRRYLTPSRDIRLLHSVRHAFMAVTSGFTTVRDVGLGYAVTLRRAIADGLIAGPRILAANSAITSTGGHGDWTIFPYDWAKTMELRGTIADGPDECRLAVRRAFREGADLIKVMLSSGGITNHAQDLVAHVEFSLEELQAIVEETHRRGARVAAHAVGAGAAPLAVAGGVDTIEHGVFEPDASILDRMARQGISLVPTIFIFRWVADEGKRAGVFNEGIEAAKRLVELQYRLVRAAHAAGVNVALGTDNNGVLGADRSAKELQLLCEAGLSPHQALQAATRNAARACGLEARVGTLEMGKVADLLVLTTNPLVEIASLQEKRNITHIVQGLV